MKKVKYICLLLSIAGLLSCKKGFLDVAGSTAQLYRENYITNLSTMNEFMNGVYLEFNSNWDGYYFSGYPEYVADNLKPVSSDDQDLFAKYTWSQNALGNDPQYYYYSNMSWDWQRNYSVIRSSCFVIENVDKYREEDNTKAGYIKGQALFFRALMHFKLVNVFGQPYIFTPDAGHPGVPYIKTSNLSDPFSRQTVKQVYDEMIADLTNAIELMRSTTVNDTRYVGVDAAKALLARIYLFKADYTAALRLAKEVADGHPLMAIQQGYPDKMFHQQTAGSELLFQATPANYPNSTSFLGQFLRGVGSKFYATGDIADILTADSRDARSSWVTQDGNNWIVTKFPLSAAGIRTTTPESDYYDPVLRSSEMFLTVAEAAYQTGDEPLAREYLNAVRKRANPDAAGVTDTGEQLFAAICLERRKELCFEKFRSYDLQRWKMDIDRSDALDNAFRHLPYGSQHSIAPVPHRDVKTAGLIQNEGY